MNDCVTVVRSRYGQRSMAKATAQRFVCSKGSSICEHECGVQLMCAGFVCLFHIGALFGGGFIPCCCNPVSCKLIQRVLVTVVALNEYGPAGAQVNAWYLGMWMGA